MEKQPSDNPNTNHAEYDTALTPFADTPPERPRKRTFGWGDAIAVFTGALVLLAVLFPVFARVDTQTRGQILDEYRHPVSGTSVTIRDADGNVLDTVVTNSGGEFIWRKKWLEPGTTFGKYGPYFYSHSSGGRDRVLLSSIGFHIIRVKNTAGKLPSDFALDVRFDSSYPFSSSSYESTLNRANEIPVGDFPATMRCSVFCQDKRFLIVGVKTIYERASDPSHRLIVVHLITIAATGTVSGRVVSANGTPVYGADIGLRRVDSALSKPAKAKLRTEETGRDGKFRFTGLVPGRYELGCGLTDGREASREIFVTSGQVTEITLKTSAFSPSPMLPPDFR